MKTYFDYEGQIGSKDVAEAIAFPTGMGPIMGFGSATLTDTSITLHPKSSTENNTPYAKDMDDRLAARQLTLRGDTSMPNFGLVNKTGHIWVSTEGDIKIDNIRGSKGSWNEVLVFAIFQDIQEPISNKPTLVAYWNGSAQSFYEYWKQSIDADYGKSESTLDDNPWAQNSISFTDLQAKAKAAVSWYGTTNTAVLIGIYGTGIDADTNNLENFALVPYGGVFPQSLPFTPAYYYKLKRVLSSLEHFVKYGLEEYSSVKAYIDQVLSGIGGAEVGGVIPVGGIIIWYGSVIPEGWAVCDGNNGTPDLRGKFVMGSDSKYKAGEQGGATEVTLKEANLPEHKHKINFTEQKWGDNANWRPFPYNTMDSAAKKYFDDIYTQPAGRTNPEPVNTLPPYYVLTYIMRVK